MRHARVLGYVGLTATLAPWVAPAETATALIVWRAVTLYASLIAGSAAIVVLARRHRRIPAAHASSASGKP